MASSVSNYLINLALDHICRTPTWAKPSAIYWALMTTMPNYQNVGGVEVGAGLGYARVNLAPLNTNYTATQGGTTGASSGTAALCTNALPIQYGNPIGGNWGLIVGACAFDALTGGNLQLLGYPTVAFQVNSGDQAPYIPAGSLSIFFPVP